jgi:hypothetical protein
LRRPADDRSHSAGRFVLQYGIKFPTALTPVRAICFVAHKA